MSSHILTLFGEELPPEQINAIGSSHAVKKNRKKTPGEETASKKERGDDKQPDILEGWQADKQYYSIGEVAALFNVKTSHIRFWTNEFALKVRTTRKGDRLFTPEQIREMRAIYHLVKERGFTISGAKSKLKANKKTDAEAIDLKQSLLQLRNRLLLIRNQL
jgi:DNA-binding transcriptional MerR regulator